MDGWIKLQRAIKEHWIWKDPVKLKWWIDILISVNHAPTKVNIGNQLFECGRGQSIQSLSNWASQWGVSKDKARNFLVLLEKDGMISHESIGKSTRITVCKYDTYQGDLHDSQTIIQRSYNDDTTQSHPNKNDKNVNNEKNDKKKSKKAGFDYSKSDLSFIESEEMKAIFLEWLDYKKETHKFSYKSESSLQAAYKQLLELSGGVPGKARAVVNQSIANGWKGLFPYNGANNGKTTDAHKNSPPKLEFEKAGSDPGRGGFTNTL